MIVLYNISVLNLNYSLGIVSRRQTGDFFPIFPRQKALIFHAIFCMKCQILFAGTKLGKYFKMSSAEMFS